jgi:hypothetical protein
VAVQQQSRNAAAADDTAQEMLKREQEELQAEKARLCMLREELEQKQEELVQKQAELLSVEEKLNLDKASFDRKVAEQTVRPAVHGAVPEVLEPAILHLHISQMVCFLFKI